MNWSKPEVVSLDGVLPHSFYKAWNFGLCPAKLAYLGILVPRDSGNVVNCKLMHIIKEIQRD